MKKKAMVPNPGPTLGSIIKSLITGLLLLPGNTLVSSRELPALRGGTKKSGYQDSPVSVLEDAEDVDATLDTSVIAEEKNKSEAIILNSSFVVYLDDKDNSSSPLSEIKLSPLQSLADGLFRIAGVLGLSQQLGAGNYTWDGCASTSSTDWCQFVWCPANGDYNLTECFLAQGCCEVVPPAPPTNTSFTDDCSDDKGDSSSSSQLFTTAENWMLGLLGVLVMSAIGQVVAYCRDTRDCTKNVFWFFIGASLGGLAGEGLTVGLGNETQMAHLLGTVGGTAGALVTVGLLRRNQAGCCGYELKLVAVGARQQLLNEGP
jgi:hypothetical protein